MNKDRRKRIQKIFSKIEDLKMEIDCISDEEQEAYDNLPESFQDSEKGEAISDNIDTLSDVSTDLETVLDNLNILQE